MNKLLEYYNNNDFENVKNNILTSDYDEEKLNSICNFFIYKLLNKQIKEFIFVKIIDTMIKTKFNILSVKNIKLIINLLYNYNLICSGTILKIICEKKIIETYILNVFKIINKDSKLWNLILVNLGLDDFTKLIFDENINKLENIFKSLKKYLKSYSNIIRIEKQFLIGNFRYDDDFIRNEHEFNITEEIINRLVLLVDFFGINYLTHIKIKIIRESQFRQMSFNEKQLYYYNNISILKSHNYLLINKINILIDLINQYKKIFNIISNNSDIDNDIINDEIEYLDTLTNYKLNDSDSLFMDLKEYDNVKLIDDNEKNLLIDAISSKYICNDNIETEKK